MNKDSILRGDDSIKNGEERSTIEESNDRDSDSKVTAKNKGGTSIRSQSTASSSGYSSTPFEVSKPSTSVAANEKSASRQKGKAKNAARRTGCPSHRESRELKPTPYFYYIDHSRDADEDPLAPLSPALSVPNFVFKLHAILIRDSLSGIIEWMPHGRSWKSLNKVKHESLPDLHIYHVTTLINLSFLDLLRLTL